MSDSGKILIVGASNMDMTLSVLRFPEKNESITDEGGVSYAPGRGGASAAIAMARLGGNVIFSTRLGQDLYGQKLYNFYKESGIDTSLVKADRDFSTGFSVFVKEADSSLRSVNFPGANEHLTQDAVAEAISVMPKAVFVNFESGFNLAAKVIKTAAARRIPVFLDASPANANIPLDTLPEIEIFSVTEKSAKRYTGIELSSTQDAMRAAFALNRKVKAKYIVINEGIKGALIYDGKRCELVSPDLFEKAVDTDASETAFSAALAVEYFSSADIKSSAKFALNAANLTSARHGAVTSVPTRDELLKYLDNTN